MTDYYFEVARPDGTYLYQSVTTHKLDEAFKIYLQAVQRTRGSEFLFQVFKTYAAGPFGGKLNKNSAGIKRYV